MLDNLPAGASLSDADCEARTLMQLGASSMSIMQMMSLVNGQFGTELTMRMVIGKGPSTVHTIAAHVVAHQAQAIRPRDAKPSAKKPGGEAAARPLAKQLISLREQQARMSKASTTMSGVASQVRAAGATTSAAQFIAGATKAMGAVNKALDPARMQQTMQDFEKQSTLMSMQQEMVDDVFEGLDAEWADDDDEVLAQVMDEIGLDVASQMSSAPRGGGQQSGAVTGTVGEVTGTAGEAPSVQAM